ncbi:MAG: hypothetical protein ACRD96_13700 [Bryobacteraceae bacterium]
MVTFAVALAAWSQSPAGAPKKKAAGKSWTAPKTAWGEPDLQGIWDFATITPLERPSELAGKETLTGQEAAEYEKQTLERRNQDRRDGTAESDVARAYNQFWWDYGTKVVGTRRTSLIVDPADGKIPPVTPEARKRGEARAAMLRRPAAGPEERGLAERCILGFNAGPPMLSSAYNNNVQIFQNPGFIVIFNEMVNDARVVPMDGRPHLPQNIRQWRGDSRGRWDGTTLVVDTTNFREQTNFRGASSSFHLVERFTRVAADTLLYEFTVDDPNTWTRPWTVAMPMTKTEGPIYEYACHEGNYGMFNLLAGARAEEKAAAEGAKK